MCTTPTISRLTAPGLAYTAAISHASQTARQSAISAFRHGPSDDRFHDRPTDSGAHACRRRRPCRTTSPGVSYRPDACARSAGAGRLLSCFGRRGSRHSFGDGAITGIGPDRRRGGRSSSPRRRRAAGRPPATSTPPTAAFVCAGLRRSLSQLRSRRGARAVTPETRPWCRWVMPARALSTRRGTPALNLHESCLPRERLSKSIVPRFRRGPRRRRA
jgi:hypothetical protein